MGPIPFTAIVEYYKIYPMGEFEEFHFIIRSMDDTLMRLSRTKETKQKDGGAAGVKTNPSKTNKNKR